MPNEFGNYFDNLIAALRAEESKQKKRYETAIDIEDFSEVTAVIADAIAKIQHLRKWIQELQRINDEIENVFTPGSSTVEEQSPETIDTTDEIGKEEVMAADSDAMDAAQCFSCFLFGKSYTVSNWKELLETLCELLILKAPYKLASLCGTVYENLAGKPVLCLDKKENEPYRRLSNSLYVLTGGSDNEIKMRCQYILSACGYSSDEIQI